MINIKFIYEYILKFLPENNRIELIWKISKIDFQRRYYNSYLGLFWALLNPIFRITIYYSVFTFIFPNKIENFTFYIFLGYIFFSAFTEGTNQSFRILRSKRYLLENIQFNQRDIYYAHTLSVLYGFLFNITSYILFSVLFGILPGLQAIWLPLIIFNLMIVILAFSLLLSSIQIFIKDLDMVWAISSLALFWATPIFYDHNILLNGAPWMKYLNPLMGIIINARNVLLYDIAPQIDLLIIGLLYALIFLGIGLSFEKILGKYSVEKM